ncbi:hypothetical protein L0337_25975 [candidate division KSB1 bacterium]|nr:hypothetical protein [candidate division KSB1 bacterium]
MTHNLKVSYDERDFLEIWNPKFDFGPEVARESGLYESFLSCARVKGAKRAFDSLMIDAFSKCYHDVIEEVRHKEPAREKENYDVPELGLHQVQLSRILEEIYKRFVGKNQGAPVDTIEASMAKI